MFLQFYNLNEQPFGVTPDPRFLYLGPAHQEAFASLVYGIETGRGFMALIAPPGLGKTTMVLRLMEKLRNSALTAFLFQTHTDSKEFLKNLLLDLAVEPTGQDLSDLQAQLQELLIKASGAGKRLVVVIDEAQNLDDSVLEMIRMLSNFETPEAKLLQIVLVGQPALADKLARPDLAQLRQRVSIITHFPLLRGDEVGRYIEHRLRVAGYKGGRLFAPAALALIGRYSRGVPRVINNLCFHALSLGYAKDQKRIDVTTLREVIADLNLESLGEGRKEARPTVAHVAREGGVNGVRESPGGSAGTGARSADMGSHSTESGSDLLDSVDFSHYMPDWTGGAGSNPRYSAYQGRTVQGRKPNHRVGVLAVLAIAAVVVCAWRAPWLGPSLDFLEQELWGEPDPTPIHEISPTTNRTANIKPTKDRQVAVSPNRGTPWGASAADINTSAQKAGGGSPSGTRLASPVSSRNMPGSAADLTNSVDAQRSVENPTGSHGAQLRTPWHATAAKKADAIVPSGAAARGRHTFLSGKDASVDDIGALGVRGKLILQSNVRGARITINDRDNPKWVTPHMFSLVAGTYIVSVSMGGYGAWSQRVHVDEGRDKWLVAQLSSDETGILTVETDPPGMQVYIDGRSYGVSRVVTVLLAGWHTCEVIPPSGIKPLVQRFHLEPGEALTKRIQVTTANASPGLDTQAQRASTAQPNATSNGGGRIE